jgi:hypothetical protein
MYDGGHPDHTVMKKCIGKILLPIALCFLIGDALGGTSKPVRLFVKEVPLKVLGKELTVIAIEQADGTQGFSPEKADGFHVEVVNQLKVPTSIHWHGLILPNLMDGVPFVTQHPIPRGNSFRYDFPLNRAALTGCIRITGFRNNCITLPR